MTEDRYTRLNGLITEAIERPKASEFLMRAMKRGRDSRSDTLAVLPGGSEFRAEVRETKERCISCQDELLGRFVENAEKRGAKVFMAKDGPAAIEYVLNIARERGAKTVSKSKSLTTEEIEINDPLEESGLRVVETDLGELIIQLAGEKPYHLVFPSVHKTREDVAEIFSKETGRDVPSDIPAIMKVVRKYLRPIFLNSDIGMTGANVGVAETGGIVIETNEGNARLVSSLGDCHICVMGVEKIVDTVEDALLMVLAHPVSATGQCPTTYVTWMGGRSPMGEDGAPRESHIIILDNGRSEMREDPAMREALHCIRCGACMNICPTYGVVGGHTFGHIYPGPIGIPWTAQVHGLENAGDFASLCISCGLCKEICPAEIDIPMMIAEVKDRVAETHPHSRVDQAMMAADSLAALGSATAPISNWFLRNGAFRMALEKIVGLDRHRNLPSFDRVTLKKRMLNPRRATANKGAKHKVAFFADVYANYNNPTLGMAAVERLEAAGCEVVFPEQRASGYPYIAYGDLDRARENAAYNAARFAPYAADGYAIVSPEPTAVYALKKSYPKLLANSKKTTVVAERTFELFEYLLKVEESSGATPLKGRRFGFHCSCHQRPLSSGEAAMEWLRKRGAEVELIETGTCCGMGGTFGLKAGPLGYDLSNAVGKPLFEAFQESGVDTIVSESSVCAIQLAEGTGLPIVHPLELLTEG
jgi:iron-sulfur cluster protein